VVFDLEPLSTGRQRLFYITAVLFIVCFIPAPVQYNAEQGLLP